jgi:hypothetical protein
MMTFKLWHSASRQTSQQVVLKTDRIVNKCTITNYADEYETVLARKLSLNYLHQC